MMAKACLREACLAAGVTWKDSPGGQDTHGEFGTVQEWLANQDLRETVRDWLATSDRVPQLAAALTAGPAATVDPAALVTYARDALFDRVAEQASNDELLGEGLAERLAEGAVLPMFGMPSRVRDLFHGFGRDGTKSVSR